MWLMGMHYVGAWLLLELDVLWLQNQQLKYLTSYYKHHTGLNIKVTFIIKLAMYVQCHMHVAMTALISASL